MRILRPGAWTLMGAGRIAKLATKTMTATRARHAGNVLLASILPVNAATRGFVWRVPVDLLLRLDRCQQTAKAARQVERMKTAIHTPIAQSVFLVQLHSTRRQRLRGEETGQPTRQNAESATQVTQTLTWMQLRRAQTATLAPSLR